MTDGIDIEKPPRIRRQKPASTPQTGALFGRLASALERDWRALARPNQLPPDGDWHIWLLQAGRGFGKTRSGAEWVPAGDRHEVHSGRHGLLRCRSRSREGVAQGRVCARGDLGPRDLRGVSTKAVSGYTGEPV